MRSSSVSSITEQLRSAWSLRINRKIEDCLLAHAGIQQKLELPTGELTLNALRRAALKHSPGLVAESALLGASLARALGDQNRSELEIDLIETFCREQGVPNAYRLFHEKGMTKLVRGDSMAALQEFLRAVQAACNDRDLLTALVNVTLCLENCGMPFAKTRDEAVALANRLKEQGEEITGELQQLEALGFREQFRSGQIAEILKRSHSAQQVGEADQADYYCQWVRMLPFVHDAKAKASSEAPGFLLCANFHLRSYRARTLQGLLHPEDITVVTPGERIDRVYLWVWRWLADREEFPVQRVLKALRDSELSGILHYLTSEDRQLLRNSLLWLSLFDPDSTSTAQKYLKLLQETGTSQSPLFEFEHLAIHYLMALRDGKVREAADYRQALEVHPLWKSDEILIGALIRDVTDGESGSGLKSGVNAGMRRLASNLRGFFESSKKGGIAPLVVDLRNFEVSRYSSGKCVARTVSEPVACALEVLEAKGSVSFEDLGSECFGLHRYDSSIHDSKIFNLVARIKKLLPNSLSLRTKSRVLISEGSWREVRFLSAHPVSRALQSQSEWRSLFAAEKAESLRPSREGLSEAIRSPGKLLIGKKYVTRAELEAMLKRPRSTTNRILKKWELEGAIVRERSSRSTRYRIVRVEEMRL